MYITKMTIDLRDALYQEAIEYNANYLRCPGKDLVVENHLRDHYGIFIRRSYNNLELRFYARCPDYKKTHRKHFLTKYRDYFNYVKVPYQLYNQLSAEHVSPYLFYRELNKTYTAKVIPLDYMPDQGHLLFDDIKRCGFFKLKYSEYLT